MYLSMSNDVFPLCNSPQRATLLTTRQRNSTAELD